ncbi:MAG TPA: helix-turn-helix transcriptional regulator, partial [Gammaproteobacteria bacterium]
MKIRNDLGDQAVLAELGRRLSHRRIEAGLTQEKLARESGVSKRTVERLEAGSSVQLTSLIRLLRTLALL